MKPAVRILVVITAVLAMVIGAWSLAAAQRNGPSARVALDLHNFSRSLFGHDRQGAEAEYPAEAIRPASDRSAVQQRANQGPAVGEDSSKQSAGDHSAEAAGTRGPGDDNGVRNESAEAAEAHGEITGTVTAISSTSVTIDGQVYQMAANAEGAANLKLGAVVKVELVTNPDGTVVVREIKAGELSGNSGEGTQSGEDSSVQHEGGTGSNSGSDGGHHGSGSGGGGDDGRDGSGG